MPPRLHPSAVLCTAHCTSRGSGDQLPTPALSPPTPQPQHPPTSTRWDTLPLGHPPGQQSSHPTSWLFIMLAGARPGFGFSGHGMSLWGPGWGLRPSQTLHRARGAQFLGWGAARGWDSCVSPAEGHGGCQHAGVDPVWVPRKGQPRWGGTSWCGRAGFPGFEVCVRIEWGARVPMWLCLELHGWVQLLLPPWPSDAQCSHSVSNRSNEPLSPSWRQSPAWGTHSRSL